VVVTSHSRGERGERPYSTTAGWSSTSEPTSESFEYFYRASEPKLRRALISRYGFEIGTDAATDALSYAWIHQEKVLPMDNPVGYLYRVGQSYARRASRRRADLFALTVEPEHWFEPGLPKALQSLTPRQRQAVILIRGLGWTFREVSEIAGVSIPTIQKQLERGMRKLRKRMGVDDTYER